MSHRKFAVLVAIWFAPALALADGPEAAAAAPAAEPVPAATPERAAVPREEPAEAPDAQPEEEAMDDEADFCDGGGEDSVVDLAHYEMEEGRLRRAHHMLVEALRTGQVEQWQRGLALTELAEVQLRMRQYSQSVVNYRKALRVDPEGVGAEARVGLATALFLRGARDAAHDEANAVRQTVCGAQWSMVACFGATSILARTGDAAERTRANEQIVQMRGANPTMSQSFDQVERRLRRRRGRA